MNMLPENTKAYQRARGDVLRLLTLVPEIAKLTASNVPGIVLVFSESLIDAQVIAAFDHVAKLKKQGSDPQYIRDVAWRLYSQLADYEMGMFAVWENQLEEIANQTPDVNPDLYGRFTVQSFPLHLADKFNRAAVPLQDSTDPLLQRFYQEEALPPPREPNVLDPVFYKLKVQMIPGGNPRQPSLAQLKQFAVNRRKLFFVAVALLEPTMRTKWRSAAGEQARETLANPINRATEAVFGEDGIGTALLEALEGAAEVVGKNPALALSSLAAVAIGAGVLAVVLAVK